MTVHGVGGGRIERKKHENFEEIQSKKLFFVFVRFEILLSQIDA